MPLLSSAILSSNTKNPAFPQRSAQPGLTHCKLSPESLPDLPFPQGNERKEISPNPHPCLPSLVFFPALGSSLCCSVLPCRSTRRCHLCQVEENLAAGMLQKFGCWNAANPSFLPHQDPEFNLDFLALDCCGCREKCAVQGTRSEQEPEGNLPFFILGAHTSLPHIVQDPGRG